MVAKRTGRQHISLYPDRPFFLHGDTRLLPGMLAYRSSCSAVRIHRSRDLISDGNDSLIFTWTKQARIRQYANEDVIIGAGEATLVSASDEAGAIYTTNFENTVISVPRHALAPLLRDPEASFYQRVPASSPGLNLLLRYFEIFYDEAALPTGALQESVVAHIYDLLGILFGPTGDAAQLAKDRGLRAARLHSLKKSIRESLFNGGMSVSEIANRHRLTPRYVQMLFEHDGTTFTEFVRNERLARACQMLSSPRHQNKKIVEIALDCGFGDLSHFNRAFRAQFGASPSEIRSASINTA